MKKEIFPWYGASLKKSQIFMKFQSFRFHKVRFSNKILDKMSQTILVLIYKYLTQENIQHSKKIQIEKIRSC